jgi:hypothetical protein
MHTSYKDTITIANSEDLEEEEVNVDQDQGLSCLDSEASDSDLVSDSDEDCDEEYSDDDSTLDYEN